MGLRRNRRRRYLQFDLRFRYHHEPLRNGSIESGNSAGTGWFIDEIAAEGLEAVTTVSEAAFTAASFTLDDIDSLLIPFIDTGDDEDDRFLLSVEGLHSGTGTGYGKPFVIRARTSYEQFLDDHFTEAEQDDPAISGESADPDSDGINNLLEHVFGTDPRVPGGAVVGSEVPPGGGPADPGISFPWNPTANYTYQLQMSTDLQTFDDIPFTESSVANGDLLQNTVEPDPSLGDLGDAAFFRLKIEAE